MTDERPRPASGDERPRPAFGDERPRPAFGEYATPEQQAAAMGKQYAPPPTTPPVAGPSPFGPPPMAPAATNTRWNVLISTVLLAWGLFNVIAGFFQYPQLAAVLQSYYTANGIGTLSDPGLASKFGVVIVVANTVIFLVVLIGTYRMLRRGRPAAYIPLLGGLLSVILIVTCIGVVLYNDPTFMAFATKGQ